jgi:hypothetical protein
MFAYLLLDTKYKRWLLRRQSWKIHPKIIEKHGESNSDSDSDGGDLAKIQENITPFFINQCQNIGTIYKEA